MTTHLVVVKERRVRNSQNGEDDESESEDEVGLSKCEMC